MMSATQAWSGSRGHGPGNEGATGVAAKQGKLLALYNVCSVVGSKLQPGGARGAGKSSSRLLSIDTRCLVVESIRKKQ